MASEPRIYAWRPAFELGIAEIDEEHRRFLDLMNDLYAAMIRGDSQEQLRLALQRLEDLAKRHFAAEEAFLRSLEYPELEAHAEQHARFTSELQRVRLRADGARAALILLKDWLLEHVLRSDRKYARWIEETDARGASKRKARYSSRSP